MQQTRRWVSLLAALGLVLFAAAACQEGQEAEEAVEEVAEEPAADQPVPLEEPPYTGGALPEGVTAEMVAEGGQIFTGAGNCFTCHGNDARGTQLAPDLTDQQWINIDGTYEQIIQVVKAGVPQPVQHPAPMPPMGGANLTDEQIAAVAAYVYSISHGG